MGAPGCDDAPVVHIELGQIAKPFTLIMPYYDNPDFLRVQFLHWAEFKREIRENMQVIIVDDCSQAVPASEIVSDCSGEDRARVRLFRIEKDVRWNWLAARNIGAQHASDGWLMMTDMDHMLPPGTAEALVYGHHDEGTIYRFMRREWTGANIHPHPNSWFYTRAMYWRVGGHDEALSGYYGTDGEYRRRCVEAAPIRIMDAALERHERIGDSSTTKYLRKQPEDARVKQLIKQRRPHTWAPKTLSFPYHEVML